MNPQERLRNAYAASNPYAKRLRKLAASFQPNELFERLANSPALRAQMNTPTRLSFGSYLAAKDARARQQLAADFTPDARLDRLLSRAADDPEAFAELSAEKREQAEEYGRRKRAAAEFA
jgi:hypothetical protein